MIRIMLSTVFLTFIFFISFTSYSEQSSVHAGSEVMDLDMKAPGIHEQTIHYNDSISRFTIAIPSSYSNNKPTPLIVALHYGGEVTPFYGRGIIELLIGPALSGLNAIIIAPDSLAGEWTNETNEEYVLFLMDSVISTYNVDKSKVIVTGYSMGGIGTWYLAGRNQDRFSAAIPVSGSPTTDIDLKIPLYAIHSKADQVIPLESTQQHIEKLKTNGLNANLIVLDNVTHYETQRFIEPLRNAIPWIKENWE